MELLNSSNPRVESLRVRCPKCTKLFLIQTRDIRETKPRFECASCHERFWIPYPDCVGLSEVTGLRVEQLEMRLKESPKVEEIIPESTEGKEPCPRCHKLNEVGASDCHHCGVIPSKYLQLKTASRIQGSERLSVLWKKIIDNYESDVLHQELLRVSSMENNLAYASAQYAQLLKLIPHDERAKHMIREIEAIVAIPISQSNKVRVHSVKQKTPTWVQGILIVGAAIVAAGIFVPQLRNLTGVGAVLLFFGAGYKLKIFNF